jgi:hypothetical protein
MKTRFLFTLLLINLAFIPAIAGTGKGLATVPLNLDHNRIIIRVGVYLPNGTIKHVNAWVDNGTPDLTITERLAKELGLITATSKGIIKPPEKIQIGGIAIAIRNLKQPIEVVKGPSVGSGLEADINLPSAVLCNYDIVLDYPGRQFTIGSPGSVHFSGKGVKGFFNPQNHLIQIPGKVDGQSFNLALDAGTPVTFISVGLISRWSTAHTSWPSARGAIGIANLWGLDDEPDWQLLRVNKMEYGGLTFPDMITVSFPAGRLDYFQKRAGIATAGLMGAASLLNYRIGIDYMHEIVYFQRISKPVEVDMSLVGLTLRPEANGRYSILGISRYGGKSAVPGILKGDILLKVNDRNVSGLTMGKAWSLLYGNPGTSYTLTMERAGKQFTVSAVAHRFLCNHPV